MFGNIHEMINTPESKISLAQGILSRFVAEHSDAFLQNDTDSVLEQNEQV